MKPFSSRLLVCTLVAFGAGEVLAFPNPFRRRELQSAPPAAELRTQELEAGGLLQEAQNQEAAGRQGGAEKIYRRIADRYPLTTAAPFSLFKLAAAQERENKYQKAFDTYQELVDTYKQSPQFGEALNRQTAIAMQSRTEKLSSVFGIRKKMDTSAQLEMFQKIISNAPRGTRAAEAQNEIARIHEEDDNTDAAIAAYKKLAEDYPSSPLAAEAQTKISTGYLDKVKDGSRDITNLERARDAADQVGSLFPDPNGEIAAAAGMDDTRTQINDLAADNAWKTGQFYEKAGNAKAALIYYSDVLRSPGGTYFEQARDRVNDITSRDPKLASTLPAAALNSKDLATQAAVDVKSKAGYFGPPPPPARVASLVRKPQMRTGDAPGALQIPITPLDEPDLPTGSGNTFRPDDTLLNPGDPLPEEYNVPPAAEPPVLPPPSEPASGLEDLPAPSEPEAPAEEIPAPSPE